MHSVYTNSETAVTSFAPTAQDDADAAQGGAASENPRKSRDENQGAIGGSAGRTLGKADGCAATGAFDVSAARTCFGAVAAGAAGVELCCAAGVTTGCATAEGMGMETLRSVEFEAEGSFEAKGSFAVEALG